MPETTTKLVEEIKEIIGITSRIDERMKNIAETQQEMNIRLNRFIDEHNALTSRVHVLESKNFHKFQDMIATQDEKIVRLAARIDMIETLGTPKQQETKHELIEMNLRLKELESHKQSYAERIKYIFNFILQGVFWIIIAYALWKLGLNSPPLTPVP